MNDTITLFRHFMSNPKEVGAVMPSSSSLSREILLRAGLKSAANIVELGPGLGAFTKGILMKSGKNSNVFCFEVNKRFCSYLSKKFKGSRIQIINAGAENLEKELLKKGVKKADCIISGLPFRNFSGKMQNRILGGASKMLSQEGVFVLFQYTTGLENALKMHFSKVERSFVALNMPPAFVYICKK